MMAKHDHAVSGAVSLMMMAVAVVLIAVWRVSEPRAPTTTTATATTPPRATAEGGGAVDEAGKWVISLTSALLFVAVSLPHTYRLTGALLRRADLQIERDGCPNGAGIVVHAVVLAILTRLVMLLPIPTSFS